MLYVKSTPLVLQTQMLSRWNTQQTQSSSVCSWRSTNLGTSYWDTFAPVVTWASVRLLLIVAKIHGLESKSIDFVLAFLQADLDVPVYMEHPAWVNPIVISDKNQRCYVLKLNKSLYGLKQASYNWFEKLCEWLVTHNFIQSQVDKCIFFWKKSHCSHFCRWLHYPRKDNGRCWFTYLLFHN